MEKKEALNSKKIQRNYFIVTLVFALIIFAIIARAAVTSFVERDYWINLEISPQKGVPIPATRGNIYSSNHELMATSEYHYRLYMDFWADALLKMKRDSFNACIKPLTVELSRMFPQKSASQYESNIMNGWKLREKEAAAIERGDTNVVRKSREYRLSIVDVDYSQLKAIRQMPFFEKGANKSGMYTKKFVKRINPYGSLASRTIGDIFSDFDKGGKTGLEMAYDSLLRGKKGSGTRQKVEGRTINVVDVKPIDGMDIISTIDINVQDMVERTLSDKLKELDAESGTAVVMEVKTGEIKAITNLGRNGEGNYGEIRNYAVSDLSDPGSTFKVASMMVALDDGLVHPDDPVDVGNGVFQYAGYSLFDHNANRGGYGMINAAKTIWFSSNIGVAKLILKAYEKDPGKYVDGLYRIGFNKDLNLEIPGYAKANIRHPQTSPQTWYKTTLPWMSFGYETQIPPIYTLTFFNAIANDGKMIKPIFVKEIQENGKTKEKKKTEVINEHICSKSTLGFIREMLDSVVNHPHGTGRPAHSELVGISGKTGTAQISQGVLGYKAGGLSHQVSFCGYFPSDNPQYSCIVVIRKPRNGAASGGNMCGTVFKKIAEDVFVQNIIAKPESAKVDSLLPKNPKVKNGLFDQTKYVLDKLNVNYSGNCTGKWMTTQLVDDNIVLRERKLTERLVPNVIGMGAKDAVYALENAGLIVNLSGRGEVYSQSVNAGAPLLKGKTILIQLK
jgi:cell division protein FtsI (penicillin-binding protein 3)